VTAFTLVRVGCGVHLSLKVMNRVAGINKLNMWWR
jgi:hypothetical protein